MFSVPTHVHAAYGLRQIPYFFNRFVLRKHVEPEVLYEREEEIGERGYGDEEEGL